MKKKILIYLSFLFIILTTPLFNLKADEIDDDEEEVYNGPKIEAKNIEIIYSEDAIIKAKITANSAQTFKNNDMVFKDGVFVEFYDEDKIVTATLEANLVKYISEKKIYEMYEGVKVKNIKKDELLKTRELTWDPDNKKIYTKRFVEIHTKDITLKGLGIDAEQDLSWYKISDPKGQISIKNKEEENNPAKLEENDGYESEEENDHEPKEKNISKDQIKE